MSDLIKPTIGRRVWYRPDPYTLENKRGLVCLNDQIPMDAGIVYVWHDRMVNLDVCDHAGNHHAITSVGLWHGDGDRPSGAYCEWMPYQKGQAAKAAEPAPQGRAEWAAHMETMDTNLVPSAPVAPAYLAYKAALQGDPDYQWVVHCNIAMPIKDALGVTHQAANQAAARLMQHLFDIDMERDHPIYSQIVAQQAAETAKAPTVTRSRVCGVDCHPGAAHCNNYCGRDGSKPMANAPTTYEVPAK